MAVRTLDVTTEDVVNLLKSYRYAVRMVFPGTRLEFDQETQKIRTVKVARVVHEATDGLYTKRRGLEEKARWGRIIAVTEEILETLSGDERAVLFYKLIEGVKGDTEVAKLLGKTAREVATTYRKAVGKIRVRLLLLKLLAQL